MGLDQYIRREHHNAVTCKWGDDAIDHGEDLKYFRKFNALHNWVMANCAVYADVACGGIDELGFDKNGMFVIENDNCTFIPIPYAKWKQLRSIAKQILELHDKTVTTADCKDGEGEEIPSQEAQDLAKELLPCTEGFFFGSQLYDNWYFRDVAELLATCNEVLSGVPDKDCDDIETYEPEATAEQLEQVRTNKEAFDTLYRKYDTDFSEFCSEYRARNGLRANDLIPDAYVREYMDKWETAHRFKQVKDIYRGTGTSFDGCTNASAYGYYAWY